MHFPDGGDSAFARFFAVVVHPHDRIRNGCAGRQWASSPTRLPLVSVGRCLGAAVFSYENSLRLSNGTARRPFPTGLSQASGRGGKKVNCPKGTREATLGCLPPVLCENSLRLSASPKSTSLNEGGKAVATVFIRLTRMAAPWCRRVFIRKLPPSKPAVLPPPSMREARRIPIKKDEVQLHLVFFLISVGEADSFILHYSLFTIHCP